MVQGASDHLFIGQLKLDQRQIRMPRHVMV
jgi:hypothetical protein